MVDYTADSNQRSQAKKAHLHQHLRMSELLRRLGPVRSVMCVHIVYGPCSSPGLACRKIKNGPLNFPFWVPEQDRQVLSRAETAGNDHGGIKIPTGEGKGE